MNIGTYIRNITNLFEEGATNLLRPASAGNLAQIGPKHGTRDTTPAFNISFSLVTEEYNT